MKYAVIDIGSNSVRLLLTDNPCRVSEKPLVSTMLSKGLEQTGVLSADAIERTARAVEHFVNVAKQHSAEKIALFATEAVRAAQNGAQFTDRVLALTGLAVHVLSGETEAQLGFLGAAAGEKGDVTIVDIGGASVELVCGKNGRIVYDKSLPLGVVRLNDALPDQPEALERALRPRLEGYGKVPSSGRLVGIGGTATSLAAIHLGLKAYDAQKVHGLYLSRADIINLINTIYASRDRLADFPLLGPNRAPLIGCGAVLLKLVCELTGSDGFSAGELDNTEGYILKYLV